MRRPKKKTRKKADESAGQAVGARESATTPEMLDENGEVLDQYFAAAVARAIESPVKPRTKEEAIRDTGEWYERILSDVVELEERIYFLLERN